MDGIKQKPIEGVSMVYTFDKANANAPTRHHTQYFEMIGERAIYHDGWYANTKVVIAPWKNNPGIDGRTRSITPGSYTTSGKTGRSTRTFSKKYPEKLKQMQALFVEEAEKYNVFPLDNEGFQRMLQPRPSGSPGMTEFSYDAPISIALGAMPPDAARDFTITANIDIPQGGAEGVLITEGGRFDGCGLYLLKGKPVFTYNLLDLRRFRWEGKQAIAPGKHTVVFDFQYDGPGLAKGGTGVLTVDGVEVAKQTIPHTVPALEAVDEWLDVKLRHPHWRRRSRLQASLHLHRHDQQDHLQAGTDGDDRGADEEGREDERKRERLTFVSVVDRGVTTEALQGLDPGIWCRDARRAQGSDWQGRQPANDRTRNFTRLPHSDRGTGACPSPATATGQMGGQVWSRITTKRR